VVVRDFSIVVVVDGSAVVVVVVVLEYHDTVVDGKNAGRIWW